MTLAEELRQRYPDWAEITPAKRLILQHLVDNGGEATRWPGHIVRSARPLRLLGHVGYVESWQRAEDRYATYRITEDGRKALQGA